jgi:hypothetical protein
MVPVLLEGCIHCTAICIPDLKQRIEILIATLRVTRLEKVIDVAADSASAIVYEILIAVKDSHVKIKTHCHRT